MKEQPARIDANEATALFRALAEGKVLVNPSPAMKRLLDKHDRLDEIRAVCRGRPNVDAVPALRNALRDEYHATVKCAAEALGKLGPAASDAVDDLFVAAIRVDPTSLIPQAYPECIRALVAIEPDHYLLPTLIKGFIGLDNWGPLKASLECLKAIGTPEAIRLLKRSVAFWMPELNKMQRRVVEQIVNR